MSGASDTLESTGPRTAKLRRTRRIVLLAAPLVLLAGAGAVWKSGLLTRLGRQPAHVATAAPPVFVDVPEIVANLDAGPRHTSYVKLQARLELEKREDEATVRAAMPRVVDLFQTYLREMRPEELKRPDSTYRLREELIARCDVALAPVRVRDVLFKELLVQ